MKKLSKADIHIHSKYSPDSFSKLESIAKKAIKRGLSVIAVTDHNQIDGAFAMKKLVEEKKLELEIVIGEEVGTLQGHILALYIEHRIPPNLSLKDAIREVKRQGGLIIVPHLSFSKVIQSEYSHRMRIHYQDLVDDPELMDMIDGIEVENFTLSETDFSAKTRFFNEKILKKTVIGSSDAHLIRHVGLSYTLFEGETAAELRAALTEKRTEASSVRASSLADLILYYWASARIPFFFFYEKISAFFRATFFIIRRFLKYKKFSQQDYQQVVKEIIDSAKKINKEKNEFYYEDRRLFKNPEAKTNPKRD